MIGAKVTSSGFTPFRIILESTNTTIAMNAQQPSHLARRMAVVNMQIPWCN